MKILKPGKVPLTTKKTTCSYCKCEFEYEPKDVASFSDPRERETYRSVKCPQKGCGVEVSLK